MNDRPVRLKPAELLRMMWVGATLTYEPKLRYGQWWLHSPQWARPRRIYGYAALMLDERKLMASEDDGVTWTISEKGRASVELPRLQQKEDQR